MRGHKSSVLKIVLCFTLSVTFVERPAIEKGTETLNYFERFTSKRIVVSRVEVQMQVITVPQYRCVAFEVIYYTFLGHLIQLNCQYFSENSFRPSQFFKKQNAHDA